MISKWRFITMWTLAAVILLSFGMCEIVKAENANITLKRASTAQKNEFLGDVANGMGYDCTRPRNAFLQGTDSQDNYFWNIECDEESYCIMIEPDARARTMPCPLLQSVTGVPCFTRFK